MKIRISVSAELTDEQTLALRTHVLPLMTNLFGDAEYKFASRWYDRTLDPAAKALAKKRRNMPGQGRTPNGEKISAALFYASRVAVLLEIVVGKKGTPAQRAAALHKQLSGDDWATRNVEPEKLFSGAVLRMKNILPLKGLLPGIKENIQALLSSPYTKLMVKTWPYIVQEIRTTIPALVKQYKLMPPPKSLDRYYYQNARMWPKIKERFIKYAQSLGFKEIPSTISYDEDKQNVSMLRDDGVYLIGKPSELNPGYQVDGKPGRYSWDRLGVESGGYQWNDSNSIEAVVDDCVEKCVQAIEKRKHRDANGTVVQFCPQKSMTLLPDELTKIVQQLKNGQAYSISPSGFGTAYIFSTTRRGFDVRLASEDITNRVGSQVYYTTEDRD